MGDRILRWQGSLKHRECSNCGSDFQTRHPHQKYCGPGCKVIGDTKKEARKRQVAKQAGCGKEEQRHCRGCGKGFRSSHPKKIYCEPRCRERRGFRKADRGWGVEERYGFRWRCPWYAQDAHGVYFVLDEDTGRLKIGMTESSMRRRMENLQSANSGRLICLAIMTRGGRKLERGLHERFSEERISGSEWFKPSERLRNFLAYLCDEVENVIVCYPRLISHLAGGSPGEDEIRQALTEEPRPDPEVMHRRRKSA